jgi:alkaline phosphatase D
MYYNGAGPSSFSQLSHWPAIILGSGDWTRHMTAIPNRPTRRRLLQAAAGAGLGVVASPFILRAAGAQSWAAGDPFSLGIASGAPRPDGFVLWTRVAPEPLSPNPQTPGGMRGGDATVGYEIATDPALRDIVRCGGDRRAGVRLFGAP